MERNFCPTCELVFQYDTCPNVGRLSPERHRAARVNINDYRAGRLDAVAYWEDVRLRYR